MKNNLINDDQHQELIRCHYLKMLGINNWYLPSNLPPFKNTPICLADHTAKTELPNNTQQLSSVNTKQQSTANVDNKQSITAINNLVKTNKTTSTTDATYKTITTTKEHTTVITTNNKPKENNTKYTIYKLLLWNVNENMLVVSDMYHPSITYKCNNLLYRILTALGVKEKVNTTPREFIWPPTTNGIITKYYTNLNYVIEAFSAFINYQLNYKNKTQILVFGNQAKYVLQNNTNIELKRGIQYCDNNKKFAITHCLSDILENPSLKLSAWEDIANICR